MNFLYDVIIMNVVIEIVIFILIVNIMLLIILEFYVHVRISIQSLHITIIWSFHTLNVKIVIMGKLDVVVDVIKVCTFFLVRKKG